MAKFVLSLVAVALVALVAAPVAAQDEKETQTVALEKILGNAQAFEGLTVSFVIQFHRLGRLDAPVFTKFEKDWYQNFSAWPDGAHLWDKETYKRDHQFFFVSRLSEGANILSFLVPGATFSTSENRLGFFHRCLRAKVRKVAHFDSIFGKFSMIVGYCFYCFSQLVQSF